MSAGEPDGTTPRVTPAADSQQSPQVSARPILTRLALVLVTFAAGFAVALAALAAAGVALPAPFGHAEAPFNGGELTPPMALKPLNLERADGNRFTSNDTRGRVSLFFFGYTTCPDVCPLTLVQVAQVRRELGASAKYVDAYFVTVDPARDTPDRLATYAAGFDPAIVPLTGGDGQLEQARAAFGVVAQRRDVPESKAGYFMDHTASVYLIDPASRVRLVYPYGTPAAAVAADIRRVLAATTVPLAIGLERPAATPQNIPAAGGGDVGPIRVERGWARAASDGGGSAGGTTAAYMTIRNLGAEEDTLLGARTDAAEAVELHRAMLDHDVMRMRPAEGVIIAPGRQIELEPSGLHLMLIDLRRTLDEGAELTLTLRFARAGDVPVRLPATFVCPL